jgi:hypothetical protein
MAAIRRNEIDATTVTVNPDGIVFGANQLEAQITVISLRIKLIAYDFRSPIRQTFVSTRELRIARASFISLLLRKVKKSARSFRLQIRTLKVIQEPPPSKSRAIDSELVKAAQLTSKSGRL